MSVWRKCFGSGIAVVALGMLFCVRGYGESAKKGIDPDKIPVAKDGKPAKSFEDMEKNKKAKKPAALSRKDKEATVRRVRALAGVEEKDLKPVPPALITLSADAIRQGKSWIGMLKGAIRPGSTEAEPAYMTIGPEEGVFLLHFEPLTPGSPYMLDCAVSAFPKGRKIWEVHGAFNGVMEDQNGHLLVGFIASSTIAKLSISRHKGLILGHLFKCELTRVD